jgi:hypothetical protein
MPESTDVDEGDGIIVSWMLVTGVDSPDDAERATWEIDSLS